MNDANARIANGVDVDNVWLEANARGPYGNAIAQNSNGLSLLSLCATYRLVVADSLFDRPNNDFGTWRHANDTVSNDARSYSYFARC